jgi:hypothetical protein
MAEYTQKIALLFCALALVTANCNAQSASRSPVVSNSRQALLSALSWLPADTETLLVANGPFSMPPISGDDDDEKRDRVVSQKELRAQFQALPISLFGLNSHLLQSRMVGREITIALEGSRHFRTPRALGEMPYEGCDIVVFARDITELRETFMKESADSVSTREVIDGQLVTVFQNKMEEDVWTFFVAFPKPNVVVIATNRDYLSEVLARIGGAFGPRALPDDLPEWRYVNLRASCWGLRHYDKSQSESDPSSPFAGEESASLIADDQAIGIVFNFEPGPYRAANIVYLSGDKAILPEVKQRFFPSEADPESTKDLHVQFRQLSPGVVQSSYMLAHSESVFFFLFVLMAAVGHGVYL